MTSPVSAVEAIEKAMEHATPGTWDVWEEKTPTKSDAIAEMAYQVENSDPFAEAVYLLNANGKCPATTGCGPTSAANAAYIAACSPDRMREVLALARQAEALKREAEKLPYIVEYRRHGQAAWSPMVAFFGELIAKRYCADCRSSGNAKYWEYRVRARTLLKEEANAE